MFKNYLVTAWRNLKKNKVFSFINISGLAIGMAVCLLILQYVNFELSYDQFNKNVADIYRVGNDRYQNGPSKRRLAGACMARNHIVHQNRRITHYT
jgi:putative ABC transport system permease protein